MPNSKTLIRIFVLSCCLLGTIFSYAQQKFTISGRISEKKSGEVIIGTTAYLLELPRIGTSTNAYGFYSITAFPWNLNILNYTVGLLFPCTFFR